MYCMCLVTGMVNGFLSHPSWQPLSRLTYTIYLLSVQMQYAVYCSTRTGYYFTHLNKVQYCGVYGFFCWYSFLHGISNSVVHIQ